MPYKRINDYGVIGDTHSAALVAADGSIDWACFPRFDSASVFAAILDDQIGGRFRLAPAAHYHSDQSYLGDTNILVTRFVTDFGVSEVTDFMPCYEQANGHIAAFHEIHRVVRCLEGRVDMEVFFQPRFDYARVTPEMRSHSTGVSASGNGEYLALASPWPLAIDGDAAHSRLSLEPGREAWFVLRYGQKAPLPAHLYRGKDKLARTVSYWQKQAERCVCHGPWRRMVVRSYLALRLLEYSPTGAMLAAATTSLPEEVGGVRNWDYRYTWLRDASFSLDAFLGLGHTDEAARFMGWLTRVCVPCGIKSRIMFGIDVGADLREVELTHLEGYKGSRPVRIGNAAQHQLQLDVFGEILNTAYIWAGEGGRISRRVWSLLAQFADAVCENWRYPDQGIWEVRAGPYHFVYSKFVCWVALNRAAKLARLLGRHPKPRWQQCAEEIREEVLRRGWSPRKRSFVQHYDTEALDASSLLMPIFGFLPANDHRMTATIERTVEELSFGGFLRRYNSDETNDGVTGSEGAFNLCTFWLIRCLAKLGRLEEARDHFQRMLGYANHLGLFSEMTDPTTGDMLGNFPQAFTHRAVILTALELGGQIREECV
ncbi:MAG: glycoside hydrolase family 15 protein [Chloroflexi bacterium]|nr:glycoside hydrolase family 15 protein [Chloroflexota bacterium]